MGGRSSSIKDQTWRSGFVGGGDDAMTAAGVVGG
jgi:hypothetical protein